MVWEHLSTRRELGQRFDRIEEILQAGQKVELAAQDRQERAITITYLVVVTLLVVMLYFMSRLLALSVAKPSQAIARVLENLQEGDLSVDEQLEQYRDQHDEIGLTVEVLSGLRGRPQSRRR